MNVLDLAKQVGLQLCRCETSWERLECPTTELEQILRGKIDSGIVVAWQI